MNRLRYLCNGILIAACLLACSQHAAAQTLNFPGSQLDLSLQDWRWLPAIEGIEAEDALAADDWSTTASGFEFGFSGRIWLRIDVDFEKVPSQRLFFFVANGFADDVHSSVLRDGLILSARAIGADVPVGENTLLTPFIHLLLPVDQPGRYSLLLNLQSTQATQLLVNATIVPEQQLLLRILPEKSNWASGVVGSMLTYIFFMAVLVVYRFQRKMLYAMLFALSIAIAVLSREGLLFQYGSVSGPWVFQQLVLSMVMLSVAMSLLYLYEDLRDQQLHRWMHSSLKYAGYMTLVIAVLNLFERLFSIPVLGLLSYCALVAAQLLLVFILCYRLVQANILAKLMSLAWLAFVITTLMRFAVTLYPQITLANSLWWNISSTNVMALVVVNYIWTVAREKFDQERFRSASESRIDLVNRLSHELRTPLNAVIGLADLLKTNKDIDTVHKYAQMIQSSGQNLLGLVNDILDFSRTENQGIELADKPFRLDRLLLEINTVFLRPMLDAGVVPAIYIDPATPLHLRGDELRVKQIMLNLVGNAIKFCQEEAVIQIRVYPGKCSGDDVELLWEVQDNGRGVTLALQDKIFEPYQQAEAGDASELKGTGLGLAITRQLVQQMGGNIYLQSTPGEGACFSFNLHLSLDPTAPDLDKLFAPLAGQRLLLCSDLDAVQNLFFDQLVYRGIHVSRASSIAEIHSHLNDIDILLTDAFTTLTESDLPTLHSLPTSIRVVILVMEMQPWLEGLDPQRFIILTLPAAFLDIMAAITEFISGHKVVLDSADNNEYIPVPGQHRILLVDDNLINLTVADKLLESLQVDSVSALSGHDALEYLYDDHSAFTLVLLDCEMPVMDGFETCRQLRAFEDSEGLEPLPVVALTAHALGEVRDVCLQAGMNEVLYKPVNRDILARLLTRY